MGLRKSVAGRGCLDGGIQGGRGKEASRQRHCASRTARMGTSSRQKHRFGYSDLARNCVSGLQIGSLSPVAQTPAAGCGLAVDSRMLWKQA